jgi:hypothetical protein
MAHRSSTISKNLLSCKRAASAAYRKTGAHNVQDQMRKKSGPYLQVQGMQPDGESLFWQAVWANIWDAILAGSWPSLVRVPLGERGPVPEVLLSRLPLILSSNQRRR